ncbi:MAG: MFS transporter [Albidovulum sp.]|nr:MFS transporter [Albidovulum sp.]
MPLTASRPSLRPGQFVSLVSLLMALVAFAIDAVLPALPAIGHDLGVQRENSLQYIILALFLGLSLGQITFGPISDSIGRKPAVYAGLLLFMCGCLISIAAPNFETMVASRVLQGIGIAGPHTVTVALVRDQYEGRRMARLMSFAMAVFILVPTIAPAIGQAILWIGGWRSIFGAFLVASSIAFTWFAIRQPETLPVGRRSPISFQVIGRNVLEVVTTRAAFGFILAAGCVNAPFVAYLSSAQQIFQEAYKTGALFPVYFGSLALAIGCASLVNGRLVMKFGMRPLAGAAAAGVSLVSIVALIPADAFNGLPPLWLFMAY